MSRRLRVLIVKPYQASSNLVSQPPLGPLYLVSVLRERFGADVEAAYWDLRLYREDPDAFAAQIAGRYDVLSISALNCEADSSYRMARALKALAPRTVVALGGPLARSAPDRVMKSGGVDWIFNGETERTFPQALERHFFGDGDLSSVRGLTWRREGGGPFVDNGGKDEPDDLDALPMPAWDLVPFDVYARRANMNITLHAKRYAPIFTSRGCPYRCHYCHDIFGKGYRWRSADSVLEEIELLTDRYGVGEFQIIDDIYNLHKPRMREIAARVTARYGQSLRFCFPNGVRADIMDLEDLPALRNMGVYSMSVAIETVTPRLQKLIDKNLDVEHARKVIHAAAALGMSVRAFFMLGFPTETPEEIERTVRFALDSPLTFAIFFPVIPYQGTPIHDLARKEFPESREKVFSGDFYAEQSWYQMAYDVDLVAIRFAAFRRFFLTPSRVLRILRVTGPAALIRGASTLFSLTISSGRRSTAMMEKIFALFGRKPAGWLRERTLERAANWRPRPDDGLRGGRRPQAASATVVDGV